MINYDRAREYLNSHSIEELRELVEENLGCMTQKECEEYEASGRDEMIKEVLIKKYDDEEYTYLKYTLRPNLTKEELINLYMDMPW